MQNMSVDNGAVEYEVENAQPPTPRSSADTVATTQVIQPVNATHSFGILNDGWWACYWNFGAVFLFSLNLQYMYYYTTIQHVIIV
jgi:hypothetical protein